MAKHVFWLSTQIRASVLSFGFLGHYNSSAMTFLYAFLSLARLRDGVIESDVAARPSPIDAIRRGRRGRRLAPAVASDRMPAFVEKAVIVQAAA